MATKNLVIAGKNQGAVDRVTFPYADTANESDLTVKGTATFYETSDALANVENYVASGKKVYGQAGLVEGQMEKLTNGDSSEGLVKATATSDDGGGINLILEHANPMWIEGDSLGQTPFTHISDADYIPANIVKGKNIFGLPGDLVVPKIEKSGTTLSIS